MKAITIIQPWATLIALGEKKFETRSWATKHRGPLAIHAGKSIDMGALLEPEIKKSLIENGITELKHMPFGAVIAIAELTGCFKSVDTWTDGYILENGKYIYSPEYEFGDFTPGRYAWELTKVRQIEPIPAKGQQGLWNWNHPIGE